MRHYCSFVVRILVDDERSSLVEGQITHVGSQESTYFRSFDEILSFVKKHFHGVIEEAQTNNSKRPRVIPQEYEID